MTSPSILITGASGFIGSQLQRRFEQLGWSVLGVGRRKKFCDNYVAMDLSRRFPPEFEHMVERVDVVLHAAARSSPWGSRQQFELANVVATERLLALSQRVGGKKFIFISSSSVYYQPQDQLGLTESSPQARPPVNHYADSKQQAEQLVRAYDGAWCILRPRAVYGVGDTVLFPRILASAAAGRLPLLIRNGPPAMGDLLAIENLVDICVQAASRQEISGEYNLTDNQPVEIVAFLLEIFERLNIPRPQRRVSTQFAFRLAWLLEWSHALLLPNREPPITRFGVHVFAYSKTFDVTKMLQVFGPPKLSVEQAVNQFIDWVQRESPYDFPT